MVFIAPIKLIFEIFDMFKLGPIMPTQFGAYHTQGNFDIKNLTNLHLPRFDELKVDETLDFIRACMFLKEYLHIAMLSFIGPLNYLKFDKFKLDKLNRLVKFKIFLRVVIGWQKHQA